MIEYDIQENDLPQIFIDFLFLKFTELKYDEIWISKLRLDADKCFMPLL